MSAQLVAVRTLSPQQAERVRMNATGLVVARPDDRWTWVEDTTGRQVPEEVAARLAHRAAFALLLTVGELRSTLRVWRGRTEVAHVSVGGQVGSVDHVEAAEAAARLAEVVGVDARALVPHLREDDPVVALRGLAGALGVPLPAGLEPDAPPGLVLDGVPGAVTVPGSTWEAGGEAPPSGRPQPSRREKQLFWGAAAVLVLATVVGAVVGDFRALPLLVALLGVAAVRSLGRD